MISEIWLIISLMGNEDTLNAIFTIGYLFFVFCFVAPPTEFVSAGLTIQNVLSNYLGSEQLHFIEYHMKRTAVTLLVHSILPLGTKLDRQKVEIIYSTWCNYKWSGTYLACTSIKAIHVHLSLEKILILLLFRCILVSITVIPVCFQVQDSLIVGRAPD